MKYSTFVPNPLLSRWVECYWAVQGIDTSIQKIVPDGYSEVIFHFGDRYNLISGDTVASQSRSLLAGQITKPIFLQPQGASDIVGIKFKPTGIWRFSGLRMSDFANQVVDLYQLRSPFSLALYEKLSALTEEHARISVLDEFLISILDQSKTNTDGIEPIVDTILKANGAVSIGELATTFDISLRKLERLFQDQVGMSAKQYSRLVRFNHVFRLIQQPDLTKTDISFIAGYFDQSHFNNEFREFAGESPEHYFHQNHTFANFFMNR